MDVIRRFFEPPKVSFFLFGPRGTGKSTLMKFFYPDALWIDLLRPDILRSYLAYPERLNELLKASPKKKIVVIDEIQKAPALLSIVHSLIESKMGYQFILTGSSSRKLKRTGADLLGGRAISKNLHPFMAAELKEKFSLEKSLQEGLLPIVLSSVSPIETLHAYINLYLHEEIQAEGLVRNLDYFTRFLEAISFSHGSLLNVSNVARECEVKRKTVENYISILEELLLAFQMPLFTKRAQRELVSHPKFYLFDTGVFQALRPRGVLDRHEEINGAALEGLVAQHFLAWNDYGKTKYSISYWRTRSGLEVDFIIYGENGFWAVEVKNTKKIHPKDLRALEEFLKDYPEAKAILLYRGEEKYKVKNVLCIPCEIFLKQLIPDQALFDA